ncbi:hypothetical protein GGS24DRAFT_500369 [Hypoxylon argillaceum]|nr:hypothetical protein GGS24DRAFT_500369 [Hypoxylon argillaceum]KAI1155890.1 hypothetical protein F4825DRAFT_447130 [Nemania diffusa]
MHDAIWESGKGRSVTRWNILPIDICDSGNIAGYSEGSAALQGTLTGKVQNAISPHGAPETIPIGTRIIYFLLLIFFILYPGYEQAAGNEAADMGRCPVFLGDRCEDCSSDGGTTSRLSDHLPDVLDVRLCGLMSVHMSSVALQPALD